MKNPKDLPLHYVYNMLLARSAQILHKDMSKVQFMDPPKEKKQEECQCPCSCHRKNTENGKQGPIV